MNKKDNIPWYRWFIAVVADGTYRFVPPDNFEKAERYIGEHGGGLYTHAGYLIFASDSKWWNWLEKGYHQKCEENRANGGIIDPPHINVPELDCIFSESAIKWLENNENELKQIGGKYYNDIPRH